MSNLNKLGFMIWIATAPAIPEVGNIASAALVAVLWIAGAWMVLSKNEGIK